LIALDRLNYKTQSPSAFEWALRFLHCNVEVFLFDLDKIQSYRPAAQAGEAYTIYSVARGAAVK
jgi:hypothetical protein